LHPSILPKPRIGGGVGRSTCRCQAAARRLTPQRGPIMFSSGERVVGHASDASMISFRRMCALCTRVSANPIAHVGFLFFRNLSAAVRVGLHGFFWGGPNGPERLRDAECRAPRHLSSHPLGGGATRVHVRPEQPPRISKSYSWRQGGRIRKADAITETAGLDLRMRAV
jgi:hypothetical protein